MRAAAVLMMISIAACAAAQNSVIVHPDVILLDGNGEDVLVSRGPVSPERTCGTCHDAEFIAGHSYHAFVGSDEMSPPRQAPGARAWETSPGLYGGWDPLFYRYLTPPGDGLPDLDTAGWITTFGLLHAGGGPARSEGVEFNCFLCHLGNPDNEARVLALRDKRFEWAATATLEAAGLVVLDGGRWRWSESAFDENGIPAPAGFKIVPPSNRHCGQCHGIVHMDESPVIPSYGDLAAFSTETKGQIFSPQLLERSGINLSGKDHLALPWDVHAEWLLKCSDCHFSPNDPSYTTKGPDLRFEGRKMGIDEFLTTPDHNFSKGRSAQGTVADHLDGTMRRCENCHDTEKSHDWLPYKNRHMDRMLCETCHIPRVYAPARQATDWTVLTPRRAPRVEYRGVKGRVDDPAALVDGYAPVLLPREGMGEDLDALAPHNLITSWYWIQGDPQRPVRLSDLEKAFFEGGSYQRDILSALDSDGDGEIGDSELLLDTPAKVAAVRGRLESLGLPDPRITAEVQPYSLHHGVVTGKWVTRDCDRCHSKPSQAAQNFLLASAVPGGVIPSPVGRTNATMEGAISIDNGRLLYAPVTREGGFYLLGHDRWRLIDAAGTILVLVTFMAVAVHGGIRVFLHGSRRPRS